MLYNLFINIFVLIISLFSCQNLHAEATQFLMICGSYLGLPLCSLPVLIIIYLFIFVLDT